MTAEWGLGGPGASGQELGTESRWNAESIAVFSHELRNSLGAVRSAAGILWMESSAGPVAVHARRSAVSAPASVWAPARVVKPTKR
jgi:hypothetical protein